MKGFVDDDGFTNLPIMEEKWPDNTDFPRDIEVKPSKKSKTVR